MAAGLGFKTFTTGEVLTAADTNGYLMQGINVFASTAARDAAITSPQEGQFAFTKDTNGLWYYDGAAWVASGATGDIEGVTAGIGISGGGTSGTVTVTNSMATAIDAKGDLIAGTGADTFDRLAVGTNDQILVADSTASTGLKWATPAAGGGGMVFLNRTTFSNVATVDIDYFSSSYYTYMVVFESINAITGTDDIYMRLRNSGGTDATAIYYGATQALSYTGTASTLLSSAANQFSLFPSANTTYGVKATLWFGGVGNTSETGFFRGVWGGYDSAQNGFFGGNTSSTNTWTGFRLLSSSSNISGQVSIYGLAKA